MAGAIGRRSRRVALLFVVFAVVGCGSETPDGPGSTSPIGWQPEALAATSTPGSPTREATAAPTPTERLAFVIGRNDYSLQHEGRNREFIVYVPATYDASRPTPVVLMFHGTNQDGSDMLENAGWRSVADREGLIVVFPTAARYFLTDIGAVGTRWNSYRLAEQTRSDTPLADDVGFVAAILEFIKSRFTVDARRIYASGFSSGGAFCGRLLVEMPEVLAAVGGGSGFDTDSRQPEGGIRRPAYVIVGSADHLLLEKLGMEGLPMEAAGLEDVIGPSWWTPTLETMGLEPEYRVEYCDPGGVRCSTSYRAEFESVRGFTTTLVFAEGAGPGVEFRFRVVKGMGHIYSDGDRQAGGMHEAEVFWEFFEAHPKP